MDMQLVPQQLNNIIMHACIDNIQSVIGIIAACTLTTLFQTALYQCIFHLHVCMLLIMLPNALKMKIYQSPWPCTFVHTYAYISLNLYVLKQVDRLQSGSVAECV